LKAMRRFVAIEYNLDLNGLRVEMTPLWKIICPFV
jgi:hypothetical protein